MTLWDQKLSMHIQISVLIIFLYNTIHKWFELTIVYKTIQYWFNSQYKIYQKTKKTHQTRSANANKKDDTLFIPNHAYYLK